MGDTSNDNLHHETHKEYALDNKNNALTHIFSSASLQSLVELSSIVLDENLDAYVSLVATSTIKSIIAVAATKSHESSVAQNSTTKCNVIRFPNMQSKDSVSLEQAIEKKYLALLDQTNKVYEQLVQIKKSMSQPTRQIINNPTRINTRNK